MAFSSSLTKIQVTNKLAMFLGKSNLFFHASPRTFQVRRYGAMATYDEATKQGRDVAKTGVDAAVRGAQQLKKQAADNASRAMEDVTEGRMQDAARKVMKAADGAWGSVKDATQQIKDKVAGNAEAVKKEAARVDRAMNTKN